MVDHLTRVTPETTPVRTAALADALAAQGFRVQIENGGFVADSSKVEARELKRRLRALGFQDGEYRVALWYERRWGTM